MEMMDILLAKSMAVGESDAKAEELVNNHFVAGTNIVISDNPDGTQTISASGEVSAEDTVAREEIANHIADTNNPHSVTKSQLGLENVDNVKQVAGLSSGTTQNNLVTWGTDGYTVADSGVAVETSISDSDAKVPTSKAIYTALGNKQDTIADLATIEAGAAAGATAVQPGDIGTAAAKNVDYFATAAQGGKADSAIQGVKVNNSAITPDSNKTVDIAIDKTTVGLGNVDNNQQVRALATTPTENNLVTWGANGYTVKNSGKAISTTVASTSTDNDIPTAKAVYTEVNKKQNKLTFDDAPTSGSSNPVKSSGIYTALSGKEDTIADLSDIRTGAGKGATSIQSVKVNGTALTPDANSAVDVTAVTGVKGNSESTYRTGEVNITKSNIGLGNVDNNKQVRALSTTPTENHITTWGANAYTVKDSGKSIVTTISSSSTDDGVPTAKAAYTELAKKQGTLTFDGTYDASTNKAATKSTVTNAINALDVTGASGISASKTISAWSETNGKVSISTQDIAITGTQTVLTGYQKSTTAGQAVAATDTVNGAIGKIEKRVSDNENNISSVQEQANWNSNYGVKNICPYNSGTTSSDGTVWNNLPIDIAAGTYSVSFSTDSTNSALVLLAADGATEVLRKTYSTTTVNDTFTISTAAKYIRVYIGAPKTISNFMIHSFGDDTYQPYALPNSDLTALSAEDRASLVELVDSGAKNIFKEVAINSVSGVTITKVSEGEYSVVGAPTANSIPYITVTLEAGAYVLSGCPSGGSDSTFRLDIRDSEVVANSIDYGNGSGIFTIPTTGTYKLCIRIAANYSANFTFKPMICPSSYWALSNTYQPYRLTDSVIKAGLSSIVNTGAKSMLPQNGVSQTINTVQFTQNSDGSVLVNGTATSAAYFVLASNITLKPGRYVLSGSSASVQIILTTDFTAASIYKNSENGKPVIFEVTTDKTGLYFCARMSTNTTATNVTVYPMLCEESTWDISPAYQPYAKTNPELTAALVELVDGGAKNALPYPALTDLSGTLASSATINADKSITITLSSALSSDGGVNYNVSIRAGTYRYSAIEGSSTAETNAFDSFIQKQISGTWTTVIRDNTTNPGNVATLESGEYRVTLRLRKGLAAGAYTFKPMLCSTAAWDISHAYQPYRPTEDEQNAQIAQKGVTVVLSQQSNSSSTYTYQMKTNDFPVPYSCGCYLISIISWGTTPTYSLYSVAYSGNHTDYTVITKIAGNDANVTVSGDTISITSSGKVTIMAMR